MTALSKELVCVLIRGDMEFWMENERADHLRRALEANPRFIDIDGATINTYEIVGIFPAAAMEEKTRRKNGEWRCKVGNWHEKGQSCHCRRIMGHKTGIVDGKEIPIPVYED